MPNLLQSAAFLIASFLFKKWLSDKPLQVEDSVVESLDIAHPAPAIRMKQIKYYVNQKEILSTHEIYYRRILSIPITFDYLQQHFIEDYHRKSIEGCSMVYDKGKQKEDLDAALCYMNDLIKYYHGKN